MRKGALRTTSKPCRFRVYCGGHDPVWGATNGNNRHRTTAIHVRARRRGCCMAASSTCPTKRGRQADRCFDARKRNETDRLTQTELESFKQALERLGWQDGRNIQLALRFGAADPEKRRTAAKELVALPADVIWCRATPQVLAVLSETRSIPIVFNNVSDPIGSGFAVTLAHPGGNVSGFTNYESMMGQRWVELLKEVAPNIVRVGVLFNPETAVNRGQFFYKTVEAAAQMIGLEPVVVSIHNPTEIESALSRFATGRAGLVVIPDSSTTPSVELIANLALLHQIPTLMTPQLFVEAGGLISYGNDRAAEIPAVASYIDRILRGEKPANLPVQAPTRYVLAINLKTAKALGLTVPPILLATADEVIE